MHHDQVGFISESPGWFDIHKSINMIYHIKKNKYENHMIFSVDDHVKKSEKFKNPFMIKKYHQSDYRENIFQQYIDHIVIIKYQKEKVKNNPI